MIEGQTGPRPGRRSLASSASTEFQEDGSEASAKANEIPGSAPPIRSEVSDSAGRVTNNRGSDPGIGIPKFSGFKRYLIGI